MGSDDIGSDKMGSDELRSNEPGPDGLESLKQAIYALSPLGEGEGEWEAFSKGLVWRRYARGEFLCREGRVEDTLFFLHRGATRNYFIREGKEFTIEFHFEGEFVTSYYSLITGEPSSVFIEAIEDIEAWCIPRPHLYHHYTISHAAERVGRLMAEYQYTRRLRREMDLLSLSAEERYARLMERNPALVNTISVKHLSSYLGIQPESLSRIRKLYNGKLT